MRKFIAITMTLLILSNAYLLYSNYSLKKDVLQEQTTSTPKKKNFMSMMIETEAGSGKYQVSSSNTWPTDGYVFNSELSKCENESKLSWDDTNKKVVMEGNVSDKCYVYFDVYVAPAYHEVCNDNSISCYIAKMYTGTQGNNNIYYHNGTIKNSEGTIIDATDKSYRFSGANPNNYVCFGSTSSTCPNDNLYRIIGVFTNENHGQENKHLVKLIKSDYANSNLLGTDGAYTTYTYSKNSESTYKGSLASINRYYWSGTGISNTWSISKLQLSNLNVNFLNNLGSWTAKINNVNWKVGGNYYSYIKKVIPSITYKNEIKDIDIGQNSTDGKITSDLMKIGLMYASDYGFAAEPSAWSTTLDNYSQSSVTSVNWMYMGLGEWTITRNSGQSEQDYSDSSAYYISSYGYVDDDITNYLYFAIRPNFYLDSSVQYSSGSGTSTDPIRIKL